MTQQSPLAPAEFTEPTTTPFAQGVHTILRIVSGVRYRKNVVVAVMLACGFLGALYYITAPRWYESKAVLLVTERGQNRLDTSATNDELLRRNNMPTFENMLRTAKVLEGAIQRLAPNDRVDLEGMRQERWVKALQKRLVVRTVRGTSILDVSYRSKDPQVAANVVHAIVESYTDFMDGMHKGATRQLSHILTQERGQLANQLNQKQTELLDARRRFADMGFRGNGKSLHPMVQRAVYFNDCLIAAQKQRAEMESLVGAIEEAVRNGQDIGQYLVTVADAVGRELLLGSLGLGGRDTTTQATLEQTLLTDRAELNMLQQNLGPMHPEVVALTERIRRTEQYLQTAQERINQRVAELHQSQLGAWLAQMVRQKLEEARQREQMLQTHFEQTRNEAISLSGQIAEIEMLERDVKRLGDMNDAMLNQIASVDLKQNDSEVRVGVLQEPAAAKTHVLPSLNIVVLMTLAGGFALSLALVSVLDALDDRFRSPEELQSRLGIPLLSTVQRMAASESVGIEALVAFAAPTSPAVEGFRTLRTALSLTCPDAHRLVISSAEPGDGKTTILANLAVCCAKAEKKTLLIDADLRRPGLTTLMNLKGPRGLSEVLRSEAAVDQLAALHIQRTAQEGLDVLPSGPRPSNPAELLGSARFSQLLSWAETVYDQVFIDSPPILAATDTAIVGRLVDGVLLVVHPTKNRRHLVLRAAERLTQMKISVLGTVVNAIAPAGNHNYGYYNYHGYYDGYEGGKYSNSGYADDDRSEQQVAEKEKIATTGPRVLSVHARTEEQEVGSPRQRKPRRVA